VSEDLSLNGRVIGSSDASFGGNLWVGGTNGITVTGAINAGSISSGTTATTQTSTDNSTKLATTAYVQNQGYLTISTASSTYAPKASPTFSGTVTLPQISYNYSSVPTLTSTSIGYFYGASGTLYPVSNVDVYSVTPPAGVYIFNIDATFSNPNPSGSGYATYLYLSKAGAIVTSTGRAWGGVPTSWAEIPGSLTGFVSVDGTQQVKFYLTSNCNIGFNYYVKYMRIA
jgi:hypothetical protein